MLENRNNKMGIILEGLAEKRVLSESVLFDEKNGVAWKERAGKVLKKLDMRDRKRTSEVLEIIYSLLPSDAGIVKVFPIDTFSGNMENMGDAESGPGVPLVVPNVYSVKTLIGLGEVRPGNFIISVNKRMKSEKKLVEYQTRDSVEGLEIDIRKYDGELSSHISIEKKGNDKVYLTVRVEENPSKSVSIPEE